MSHPPPGGPPYPPQQPPWPPQQWSPGPPPKKRGNGWKWALGAVALLAVIGVTVAVTISVTKDDGTDDSNSSANTFGLASADDNGPANIITEDPTCAAWTPINDTLGAVLKRGWNKRDPNIPATDWTPELRSQYEEVGRAIELAADQSVRLATRTPHRVMRELYEQFIAYGRAFSDSIPSYTPHDNHLAAAAITTTNVLVYICSAVAYGSAESRAPLIDAPPAPAEVAPLTDPKDPSLLLTSPDPTCPDWERVLNQLNNDTKAWQELDPNVPATAWTTEQRAVVDAVIPLMKKSAEDFQELGSETTNPTLQDLAVFASQYRSAYAEALPTYTVADNYLDLTAYRVSSVIYEACRAVSS